MRRRLLRCRCLWRAFVWRRRARKLDRAAARLRRTLDRRAAEIGRYAERVAEAAAAAKNDIAEARATVAKYEEALDEARARLRIAEDVTVPALVSANRMLLERWDAETAIEVRRRVAASPGGEQ